MTREAATAAVVLREAAALMRQRAEAATPSPWLADVKDDGRAWVFIYDEMDSLSLHGYPNDAEHIASWQPTVALAVADWLDAAADHFDPGGEFLHHTSCPAIRGTAFACLCPFLVPVYAEALTTARAYLGSDS